MKTKDNIQNEFEKNISRYSRQNKNQLLEEFGVDEEGLNQIEAEERLEKYGRNIIDINNNNKLVTRVKESIINPFNLVLIIVAIFTYFTDIVISKEANYATFFMLLFIVFISGLISFVQSEKSSNAARKLQSLISNKVDVIRNGHSLEINIEEVVQGDIVKLASGDMIPGDVRFLEVKDLFVDQSQLTGESNPVEKFSTAREFDSLTEISNIGFMGSNIVSGTAIALILTTGKKTYFGSMAKSLSTFESKTTFERDVDSISKLLIKFIIFTIPIIFIVNLFTKSNWVESLIFGITIAVSLMPEMLPVIMTSSLAKGAVKMSKKETIVKRLGAIQTFGEMDVLCTDKTGTLTENRVILEKYMDITGKEDKRILRHSFLNSYFQTGMKNLMDIAIINRAKKEDLVYLKDEYVRVDEIPFDFARRRMSVVLKDKNGKRQLITKGAVDEIFSICSYIEKDGKVIDVSDELLEQAKKVYEENTKQGIRVIAIAQKNEIFGINTFRVEDEKNMVFIGFVGFLDPTKKTAKSAIATLKKHGVKTVVLTGDSQGVAINVCQKLDIPTNYVIGGKEVEEMTDEQLKDIIEKCYVFTKLTPFQKKRVVKAFQENGHTVGYMGDGINDSPPLKQADVGISVDTAVDIAKEVADIILLQKDLHVLDEGVIEGRRTFTNISKYLKMAISGNFGNMFSILIASIFLPFLPLKPIHILIQNILNDSAQLGMPFDKVEPEYIEHPKKWDITGIKKFMIYFGLLSTLLDILCFILLWYVFKFNSISKADYFQCGWFMFGVISQTLIINTIRTHKIPFIQSNSSKQLTISTIIVTIITLIIGFTSIANVFDLKQMGFSYIFGLIGLMIVYLSLAQIMKKIYIKINKEWI